MIGETLGHYQILEELGRGGMGEVYLAHDNHLKRKVALKFLRKDLNRDQTARKRLLQEARSAALLDHPFICKIYQAVDTEEHDFIVMEYLDGETLRDALKRGPLPPEEVLRVATETAEALESAHDHGIVHRDLKPGNIMLGNSGHVKVMDFGLAKQPGLLGSPDAETATGLDLTAPGTIVGTLEYMSPEQLRGSNVDARSDMFSFGITILEALTGKNPLRGASHADTISAIVSPEPVALPVAPDVSPSIPFGILRKMVEKDPADRYQSMKDLLRDLRLARTGSLQSIELPSVKQRPKLKWLAIAGMVVGAAAGLALLLWYILSPPKALLAFQERDWIVAADFENETGEPIFDKSLDTALRVSIEQSSFVNLLPRSRIEQTLRRMKKTDVSRIDESLAREIAKRESISILLVPSITGIGGTYMISTTLEDADTGARITSDSVRIQGKEGVLAALDQLAGTIRRRLGEKRSVISNRAKKLAEVTTANLAALRQFSLGLEANKASRFEQAKTYYENALSLDPEFTLAQASLGMINFERFDPGKGKQLLSKAVQATDDLTDREKYAVLAAHARVVENDIPKTIQQWKVLSGMYPDDAAVHNNLGWFYGQIRKYPEAIQEYKEALRIDPQFSVSYHGLEIIYLHRTGDATAGIDVCLKEIAVDEHSFWAHFYLGWAYLGSGQYEAARAALQKALQLNTNPQEDVPGVGKPYRIGLYRLAYSYWFEKKYAEALRTLQRLPKIYNDPYVDYEMGIVSQLMKDNGSASRQFGKYRKFLLEKEIRSNPADAYNHLQLALVSQRMGLASEAQAAFRKAVALAPEDHFDLARFYSVAGKPEEATGQLELAVNKGFDNLIWMKIHPDLQNLSSNPRFQALLQQHLR